MRYSPKDEIPLIDWSWHKRHLDLTDACGFFYIVPLVMLIIFDSSWWRWAGILASAGFGFSGFSRSRKWIAGVVLVLMIWPDDAWRFFVWALGCAVTCYADGALKNKPPQPPKGEWD